MNTNWLLAAHITLHCLLGCVIGEIIGLTIGVSINLSPMLTMSLSTLLAFLSGMFLAVLSVANKSQITYGTAIKTVWFGEVVSIVAMEIAMNGIDYVVGGVTATSILDSIFWIGLVVSIPIGYIAALPVNYWLVNRNLKKCH